MTALYGLTGSQPDSLSQPAFGQATEEKGEVAKDKAAKPEISVAYVQVPLPLIDTVDQHVQQRVSRAINRLTAAGKRPTLILEFHPEGNTAGEGSDFGRAHSLARFLVSEELAAVKTVAFLPQSVKGHAVLPILACEQIVMARDAEIGNAGADEKLLDETMRGAYREFADRRRTVNSAVALGFLDNDLEVTRVITPDGIRYELPAGLADLRAKGRANKEDTLFAAGGPHVLTGSEMRLHGFATHLAEDKAGLATALGLPPSALRSSIDPADGWQALRVDIDGPITIQKLNWVRRVVDDHAKRKEFNLLCIFIQSAGGKAEESIGLASKILDFPKDIRTVAVVQREALADAGVIAWACDDLVMWDTATIGGQGDNNARHRKEDRDTLRAPLERIAELRQRNWSLPLAMVDSDTQVWPYQRVGSTDRLYLSPEEWNKLPEKDSWEKEPNMLNIAGGLDAKAAADIGLATHVVHNMNEFRSLYHLPKDPKYVRSHWALQAIEALADKKFSAVLLFVAMFALMIEFSSPGVGLPGFISLVCFVLFFWSNFLHGNATGLEICLFGVGVICVLIEIFIAPGTFVFGIGGGLMVVTSLILASQTFVLPTNVYQLKQLPVSLGIFTFGITGGIVAIGLIRRYLPDTPYFNKMILKPPQHAEIEERQTREQLVKWAHLAGKRGTTTTALFPSGKALFGDEMVDVVSAGEMIEKGASVVVLEVLGSRVLVREGS